MTEEKDKIMKEKICKWVKAITFGLVCFGYCIKPDVCDWVINVVKRNEKNNITIIIFKDGEEVARFQADLSFKMVATEEEVQEEIDNQLMSDF